MAKMQYDKDIWGDILAAQVGAQKIGASAVELSQCQVLLWSQHCGVFSFRCPLWRCWPASHLGLLRDLILAWWQVQRFL